MIRGMPPLSDAQRLAYIDGWLAGATSDAWPRPRAGMAPCVQQHWERGVYAGRVSRIQARQAQRAKP